MLRQADAIHYTSHAEQWQAERALGLSRGVVVPLGVDAERPGEVRRECAQGAPGEAGKYVLALGRLHPVKGLELLIEAFVDMASSGSTGWKLKLAGDGNPGYVEQLKRLVRTRSAEHLVEFAGWLTGDEKESALCSASLLAMPSHQENFGAAMFEALARGVPVLVSDQVDWAVEVAAAGAGWVSQLDRRALRDALAAALGSPADRASRGVAGQILVRERFAWPAIAAQMQQCYQEIVAGVAA